MTGESLSILFVALVGAVVAAVVAAGRVKSPPERLIRTNHAGRAVPAVLGDALCAGALVGVLVMALGTAISEAWGPSYGRMLSATALVVAVLWAAGRWDDSRGDERPRGFSGHIGAARGGRVTGGLVKLVAGGLAGLAAGALVTPGWRALVTGAVIALAANFVNLLDRAPGRAGKVGLLVALPMIGSRPWLAGSAALLGALLACMFWDLREKGMLGDAGANPLGGVLGLGLAVSLDDTGRLVALAVLLALNLLSERYSFSRAIDATPVLR